MSLDSRRTLAAAVLLTVSLALAVPAAAMATPGLIEKSDSTFRLHPGQDRIKVNIGLTLTNRKPATTTIRPCTAGSSQRCRFRINYFWNEWGNVYIPAGATKVKFSSPGLRTTIEKKTKHWIVYKLSFPNLNFGQTRRIRTTYELQGGKPRSRHRTRVTDAYTYFCWHGEPGDSGRVTAILPPGYEASTFSGKTRTKTNKKGTTIKAAIKGDPSKFYACTDAFKPSKLIETETTSPDGRIVIVQAWPEDPEWSTQMTTAVEDTLPKLEDLIGRPLPLDEVVVREVSRQSLYGYGIQFGVRHAVVRLGEHIDDPTSAPRGLSSVWFNHRKVADTWLSTGLSEWAGNEVSLLGCWPAGEYPGKGKPSLSKWKALKEKPSERLEAIVVWQGNAACSVISDVADEIGKERMQEVIAALLDGTPKYGRQPTERAGKFKKVSWKDWLDAVDEIGLLPSGETDLTVTEQALKDVGIAKGKQLRGRIEARTAYHEVLAALDGTPMPRLINDLMGKWKFKPAMNALPVATATYEAIMANELMADADREAFFDRFESARSLKGLRALAKEAKSFEPSSVEPIEMLPAPAEVELA
jgi:hypothetical protein